MRPEDLERLQSLGVNLKLDIVLNHLSVGSPEFKDLMSRGDDSPYLDFFIDWNKFWSNQGTLSDSGVLDPMPQHKQKLFMRKSGLPVLQVPFPDNSFRPYWNTFYQKISYLRVVRIVKRNSGAKSKFCCISTSTNCLIKERPSR